MRCCFTFHRKKQNTKKQDCHWFNKEKRSGMVAAAPTRSQEIWVPILPGSLTLLGPHYFSETAPLWAATISPTVKSMGWSAVVTLGLGCMWESPGELIKQNKIAQARWPGPSPRDSDDICVE